MTGAGLSDDERVDAYFAAATAVMGVRALTASLVRASRSAPPADVVMAVARLGHLRARAVAGVAALVAALGPGDPAAEQVEVALCAVALCAARDAAAPRRADVAGVELAAEAEAWDALAEVLADGVAGLRT